MANAHTERSAPANGEPDFVGRLIYGSLAMPLATIGLPVAIYLAPFYAGELGLPLALVGTAMFLARMGDVITDPLIGALSDRWRPAIGRRKIWMIIGAIVMLAGVVQLFTPRPPVDLVYFIIWISVVYLGFTMLYLPHEAWGAELSSTYDGRTRITGARQFFNLVGLVAATVVPAIILSRGGATAASVLKGMSWSMLILLPICAILVVLFTPDRTAPVKSTARIGWRRSLQVLVENRPFATIATALFLGNVGETFRITITLFFARDVIGAPNIGLIYVYYFVTALVSVPFWVFLGNRIGKHRALGAAFAALNIVMFGMFFLKEGQVSLFTALFVMKGFCFGSLQFLPSAMIADTIDLDRLKTGQQRQGALYAISGVGSKIGMAIGQGLSLNLLAAVGFQSAGGNDAEALCWLSFFYAVFPALFILPAMALVFGYSLTAERHAEVRRALDAAAGPSSVQP
jgi:Na+/melibiose symporter-like transporter